MSIAQQVKELRALTGAGIVDVKNALEEAGGDTDKAIEILHNKGIAKAAKKADRQTQEGAIAISGKAIVKLLCETDFVARNQDFLAFVTELAEKADREGKEVAQKYFEEVKPQKLIQMGENLVLDQIEILQGTILGGYIHSNKKIAALVALSDGKEDLAKDIAMHIVGMKPTVIYHTDLDPGEVEKETQAVIAAVQEENVERKRLGKPLKTIPQFISRLQISDQVIQEVTENIRKELQNEKKPEQIWDKIIPGKLERFIDDNTAFDKENVLMHQEFVKDPSKKIKDLLREAGVEVIGFVRVEI